MYLKATNGVVEKYPYSIGLLRKDNPRTSFPKNPTDAVLAGYGMYPVREANPTVGTDQKLVKSWTPEFINGEWILNHQAVDMTAEEIAERDGVIAANVREDRDKRLVDTDWTQVADAQVDKAVWATYRQALRDVPAQEGFPHDVTWPDQPE
jgi:hypothetical protein